MDKEYSPIVISGPSGAGKSELISYIEKRNNLFLEATGCTTRERRQNEVGRMDFVSKNYFENLIKNDELIEYCIYNGNYYGVPKSELLKLAQNYLIFNVNYGSAKVIRQLRDNAMLIYLMPPTKGELLKRIGQRGEERYRIGIEDTMNYALNYDYLLISQTDNFDLIYDDFLDIAYQKDESKSKKLIHAKNKDFINNFYK